MMLNICKYVLNSLPNNKIFRLVQVEAFADNKIKVTQKLKFVLGWVEDILGKGENAGNQHFLLFPKCFQKPPSSGSSKVEIVRKRDNPLTHYQTTNSILFQTERVCRRQFQI